jgi:predicted dehydrogenase
MIKPGRGDNSMKFLVIGLGSMGKRRVRCLQTMGYKDVAGFDIRQDRRDETMQKYGIKTYENILLALSDFNPDAFIISVPPMIHHEYIKLAFKNQKHFFVEASVVDTDMEDIKKSLGSVDIVAAPSATMIFHPAIKQIIEIIKSGDLGTISNVIFHSGQYLPDWHTYEKVSDYYVSNPATGGAREIVPFELTWITHIWGFPKRVCGNVRKTINIDGAEKIEDTYNFLLDYEKFLATITIDVVSRYATRRLLINGDQRQLIWDWNQNNVQIYNSSSAHWEIQEYEMNNAEAGYNPNIGENMYIDELHAFIRAIQGQLPFINTIENDYKVLKLLYAVEQSDKIKQYVDFKI